MTCSPSASMMLAGALVWIREGEADSVGADTLSLALGGEALDKFTDGLADRIAAQVLDRLNDEVPEGYLNSEGAARFLGLTKSRIHDLKSMGVLVPDGYDGRTPLFTRETLRRYVESGGR